MPRARTRFRFGRLHGAAGGALVGALVGLIAVLAVDRLVHGAQNVWWAPAGTVVGLIAGAVLGMLFAVELEGETEA